MLIPNIFFDALAKKHETFFDFGPYQVDLSGNEVPFIPLLYHPVNPKYDDLLVNPGHLSFHKSGQILGGMNKLFQYGPWMGRKWQGKFVPFAGGELDFEAQSLSPREGLVAIFPHRWLHRSRSVTSGCKRLLKLSVLYADPMSGSAGSAGSCKEAGGRKWMNVA